jgi:hypothetical protein
VCRPRKALARFRAAHLQSPLTGFMRWLRILVRLCYCLALLALIAHSKTQYVVYRAYSTYLFLYTEFRHRRSMFNHSATSVTILTRQYPQSSRTQVVRLGKKQLLCLSSGKCFLPSKSNYSYMAVGKRRSAMTIPEEREVIVRRALGRRIQRQSRPFPEGHVGPRAPILPVDVRRSFQIAWPCPS